MASKEVMDWLQISVPSGRGVARKTRINNTE
jgi:hypothetical protein